MILVDTSVWVDHLCDRDRGLSALLDPGQVLVHPFIAGELALGHLRQREFVIHMLGNLPQASVATDAEVLQFIDRHALFGTGIGYVDAHLLGAARLMAGASIWTRDKNLLRVAKRLGLATTAINADMR